MPKYLLLSFLFLLCISCKREESQDAFAEFKTDSTKVIVEPDIENKTVALPDTTHNDSVISNVDSTESPKDTIVKDVHKSKTKKPKEEIAVIKSKPVLMVTTAYFSIPKTVEEAKALSHLNFEVAKTLINSNPDSALFHVRFAAKNYENGSLFAMSAYIFFKKGRYSEAVTAADRSIIQNDHWDAGDLKTAYRIKAEALEAMNKKYPSDDTWLKATNARNQYEVIK